MSLGQWLKSLSSTDHIILLVIYSICIYFSKVTLDSLIEFYNNKRKSDKFRTRLRITPIILLSLGFLYSIILYKILDAMFEFIP